MKCGCGKQAVMVRPYEGRALCQKHFLDSVDKKVAKEIVKHKMIVKGDRILIALSGDPASATLAAILAKMYGHRPDIGLLSLSIRGMPDSNMKVISRLIKRLRIAHNVVNFNKIFKHKHRSPGQLAIARRWILNREAKKLAVTKIAVATTLDDEAQSVLLNFLRGDVGRFARLGPVTSWSVRKTRAALFIPRIKPLRVVPKAEIELYTKLNKLPYTKKKSKGMRDELSVFLNRLEQHHPGISFSIVQTADKLLPAAQRIAEAHEGPIIRCRVCGEPGSQSPCRTCQIWRTT